MGPKISKWLVDTQVAISRMVASEEPLTAIESKLRRIVAAVLPMANRNESAYLVKSGMAMARRARSHGFGRSEDVATYLTSPRVAPALEHVANEMDKRLQLKAKRERVAEMLESCRNPTAPTVFYAVSTHQKPAHDHAKLQGTVAYDRNWRAVLGDSWEWYLAKDVGRYIREHDLNSLQELMGPPWYMITRPYCRHRFVPLDTYDVLDGVANLRILDGEHRSLTDAQRYQAYKKRRARVVERSKTRR